MPRLSHVEGRQGDPQTFGFEGHENPHVGTVIDSIRVRICGSKQEW